MTMEVKKPRLQSPSESSKSGIPVLLSSSAPPFAQFTQPVIFSSALHAPALNELSFSSRQPVLKHLPPILKLNQQPLLSSAPTELPNDPVVLLPTSSLTPNFDVSTLSSLIGAQIPPVVSSLPTPQVPDQPLIVLPIKTDESVKPNQTYLEVQTQNKQTDNASNKECMHLYQDVLGKATTGFIDIQTPKTSLGKKDCGKTERPAVLEPCLPNNNYCSNTDLSEISEIPIIDKVNTDILQVISNLPPGWKIIGFTGTNVTEETKPCSESDAMDSSHNKKNMLSISASDKNAKGGFLTSEIGQLPSDHSILKPACLNLTSESQHAGQQPVIVSNSVGSEVCNVKHEDTSYSQATFVKREQVTSGDYINSSVVKVERQSPANLSTSALENVINTDKRNINSHEHVSEKSEEMQSNYSNGDTLAKVSVILQEKEAQTSAKPFVSTQSQLPSSAESTTSSHVVCAGSVLSGLSDSKWTVVGITSLPPTPPTNSISMCNQVPKPVVFTSALGKQGVTREACHEAPTDNGSPKKIILSVVKTEPSTSTLPCDPPSFSTILKKVVDISVNNPVDKMTQAENRNIFSNINSEKSEQIWKIIGMTGSVDKTNLSTINATENMLSNSLSTLIPSISQTVNTSTSSKIDSSQSSHIPGSISSNQIFTVISSCSANVKPVGLYNNKDNNLNETKGYQNNSYNLKDFKSEEPQRTTSLPNFSHLPNQWKIVGVSPIGLQAKSLVPIPSLNIVPIPPVNAPSAVSPSSFVIPAPPVSLFASSLPVVVSVTTATTSTVSSPVLSVSPVTKSSSGPSLNTSCPIISLSGSLLKPSSSLPFMGLPSASQPSSLSAIGLPLSSPTSLISLPVPGFSPPVSAISSPLSIISLTGNANSPSLITPFPSSSPSLISPFASPSLSPNSLFKSPIVQGSAQEQKIIPFIPSPSFASQNAIDIPSSSNLNQWKVIGVVATNQISGATHHVVKTSGSPLTVPDGQKMVFSGCSSSSSEVVSSKIGDSIAKTKLRQTGKTVEEMNNCAKIKDMRSDAKIYQVAFKCKDLNDKHQRAKMKKNTVSSLLKLKRMQDKANGNIKPEMEDFDAERSIDYSNESQEIDQLKPKSRSLRSYAGNRKVFAKIPHVKDNIEKISLRSGTKVPVSHYNSDDEDIEHSEKPGLDGVEVKTENDLDICDKMQKAESTFIPSKIESQSSARRRKLKVPRKMITDIDYHPFDSSSDSN